MPTKKKKRLRSKIPLEPTSSNADSISTGPADSSSASTTPLPRFEFNPTFVVDLTYEKSQPLSRVSATFDQVDHFPRDQAPIRDSKTPSAAAGPGTTPFRTLTDSSLAAVLQRLQAMAKQTPYKYFGYACGVSIVALLY